MFGNNPVRKQKVTDGSRLEVTSIFRTIQGEGPFSGVPAIFIRLAGCNLRCRFCDTEFESGIGLPYRLDSIMEQVDKAHGGYRCPLVVITGGEPFRQNIIPLVSELHRAGFHVQIETAGTLWLDSFEQCFSIQETPSLVAGTVSIVVSPKTGRVKKMIEKYACSWKYIVRKGDLSPIDGLPQTIPQQGHTRYSVNERLARPPAHIPHEQIYLQPCEEYIFEMHDPRKCLSDTQANKLNMIQAAEVCMKMGYRLSLQIHKILGLE